MPASRIFICYRREDSSDRAHWLDDSLSSAFGEDEVFIDLDVPAGVDVRRYITEKLSSCAVLLVMIGPDWLMIADEHGERRLDSELDYVRLEIATALRNDTHVIPLLVKGARMPSARHLPSELASLADRNALTLSDGVHRRDDVKRLIADLKVILKQRPPKRTKPLRRGTSPGMRRAAPRDGAPDGPEGDRRATSSGTGPRARRRRSRAWIAGLCAAAAAAIVAALVASGSESPVAHQLQPSPGSIVVKFDYSPEKAAILAPLIQDFNDEHHKLDGRAIFAKATATSSGEAADAIARRRMKPDAWAPAQQFWGQMLNYQAKRLLASAESPTLVRGVMVLAMWKQLAEALGYPDPVGFRQIFDLARSGWASIERPELGTFRFVHTNPLTSTTGVGATVAEYAFASGKQRRLEASDVTRPSTRAKVAVIERAVAHSGDATSYVVKQLKQHGRDYASAVLLGEDAVLAFNEEVRNFNSTRRDKQRESLVAIYPHEGTYVGEHPYYVLDASWVKPLQRRAARELGRYLVSRIDARVATDHFFRPADRGAKLPVERWRELGVDTTLPLARREFPQPPVIEVVRRTWRKDRKPANILIVFDTSGSMNKGTRLARAKDGVLRFVGEIAPQDRVGLTTYSDAPRTVVSLDGSRRELVAAVRGLKADGGTATYDATASAIAQLSQRVDRDDIDAVVLLTDGNDNRSDLDFDTLLRRLTAQSKSPDHVRLYTIAYGPEAAPSRAKLKRLAETTGGKAYDDAKGHGDEDEGAKDKDIREIYRELSSLF